MSSSARTLAPLSTALDLKKLKAFNPALIYGFDPEPMINKGGYAETLAHSSGQFKDMYNAYLYSETVVLPFLKTKGLASISPDDLLKMINEIHARIAITLAKDQEGVAGQYTTIQTSRWHHGWDFGQNFLGYISGNLTKKIFYAYLSEKKISTAEVEKFAELFKTKFGKDLQAFYSFIAAVQEGRLTKKEKILVDAFVKVPMSPEKAPAAMLEFAKKLIEKMKQCDPADAASVNALAFFVFNELVQIHPYFNANGRLACNVMNTVLLYLGKPSILLRYPKERDDKASSYSKAIEYIDEKPELLLQHIRLRLAEPTFKDVVLEKAIEAQVDLWETVERLKLENPSENFDKLVEQKTNEVRSKPSSFLDSMMRIQDLDSIDFSDRDINLSTATLVNKAVCEDLRKRLKPDQKPKSLYFLSEQDASSQGEMIKAISSAGGQVILDKKTHKITSFSMPCENLKKDLRVKLRLDRVGITNIKPEQSAYLEKCIPSITLELNPEKKTSYLATFPVEDRGKVTLILENWTSIEKASLTLQSCYRGKLARSNFFHQRQERKERNILSLKERIKQLKDEIIQATMREDFPSARAFLIEAEAQKNLIQKEEAMITPKKS